ncbi:[citrate (pro-3S)-lyase] ligase [Jeotgalibaca sp. A122]|uniref:[citrate (pro-3S)-lyase] ligase n=1 Tax=Jeotgalibaca sp. A122 TaxID=3457322 RepID=UPI003FD0451D
MEQSYNVKRLWINKNKQALKDWHWLLDQAHIRPEEAVDYTVAIYDGDGIIATGSLHQNVLKCIAVCKSYTGGGVINTLISHLMNEVFEKGYSQCYVYTKPESVQSFLYMGFKEIARVENHLVFLEKATKGFDNFLEELKTRKIPGENIAGIVMNANPFTLGHQYLIEKASKENDVVHVFVLSEDLSVFPQKVRKELVEKGTAHLSNVLVHDTGDYMVSAKTFPSYFLREEADVTEIQARLDALIFCEKIAPALNINRRYVGMEPLSFATNIYNEALKKVFGKKLELIILERKQVGADVISASRVRQLLKENKVAETRPLLPDSTYEFLNTAAGAMIIHNIQNKE